MKPRRERPRKHGLRKPTRDRLYRRILIEHRAVERDLRDSLVHARRAGELLQQAKDQMRHGTFMDWIAKWNQFSHATANLYMRIAREWPRIKANSESITNFTLGAVDAWLRKKEIKAEPDYLTLTGRSRQWLKDYHALHDRLNDFLQAHGPEYQRLWMIATMNRVEAERVLAACESLRQRVEHLIGELERHIAQGIEQDRLDALGGEHDKDADRMRSLVANSVE